MNREQMLDSWIKELETEHKFKMLQPKQFLTGFAEKWEKFILNQKHSEPQVSEGEFGPVDLTDVEPDKVHHPQPISEERIDEMAKEIADKDGGGLWGEYYRAARSGIKAALKELNVFHEK